MKVRIIKSINEDLLDEAKEDDLIAKYKIGMGKTKSAIYTSLTLRKCWTGYMALP